MLILTLTALSVSCGKNDTGYLTAVSREDGSGTRAAFTEIFGIETLDEKGNKIDATSDLSEVTNSTSVMITTVKRKYKKRKLQSRTVICNSDYERKKSVFA